MGEAVTFLLTEVVDSISRWEADEAAMATATTRLDAIVAEVVAAHRGHQVKPRGEGDSHFLTFGDPCDAVACAVVLQRRAPGESGLTLRSSCHTGEAEQRDGDWYGTTVNRCARLRAAAHAGQALVSAEVAAAVAGTGLSDGVVLRSLGRHRLKDLDEAVEVLQICAAGLVADHPPLLTVPMTHGLSLPRSSLVGRDESVGAIIAALQQGALVTVTGAPGVGTTRTAMHAAAAWWDQEGEAVAFIDGAEVAGLPGDRPAVVTAAAPLGEPDEVVVRLGPLDDLDAGRLLQERLPVDVSLPHGVVEWCDGLPLAVELLARRAATLDAEMLVSRLQSDPLSVLGGDRRADPARHAGMRATFDASFEALDPEARHALLHAPAGESRWVAAGWHELDGPLPLVARFLDTKRASP